MLGRLCSLHLIIHGFLTAAMLSSKQNLLHQFSQMHQFLVAAKPGKHFQNGDKKPRFLFLLSVKFAFY